MSRYTADEEERVRTAAKVRDWTKSGLLNPKQGEALEATLRTDLKRTNRIFRGILFIFGTIVVWTLSGLVFMSMSLDNETAVSIVAIVLGLGYVAVADWLVASARLYRFGVEEALAAWAVAFIAGGVGLLVTTVVSGNDDLAIVLGLVTAAAASYGLYARLGLVYAAVVAVACAALMPFFFNAPPAVMRLSSAAILIAVIVTVRAASSRRDDGDYPGDDYSVIEACTWVGLYVVFNLVVSSEALVLGAQVRGLSSPFYWFTYLMIWVLPPVALFLGVAGKRRMVIWAGLAMAGATLVTSKSYLGWPRHTWDPIFLGLLLTGGAVMLRRWLACGDGGQRFGFTPDRELASERQIVDALGTVAGIGQAGINQAQPAPAAAPTFEPGHGGRSGGAGASGSF